MLRTIRFVAIMFAALTVGMGLCHLMQLPARIGWDQYLWVGSTVQVGLYAMFGSLGAVIDIGAVVALGVLAYLVHEHRRPGFPMALIAALPFRVCAALMVGPGLSRECAARLLGERRGATGLDRYARPLGMGSRYHRGHRACRLRRADRIGAR